MFKNCFGFVRQGVKMRLLISNVSTGNIALCRGQRFACELLVERAFRRGEGMEV